MPVIVGAGRSGTTLLRLMLDAHPELAIPPETGFIVDAIRLQGERPRARNLLFQAITERQNWPGMGVAEAELRRRLEAIEPFDMAEGLRAFYRLYAGRFGKPRWGDKTPYYLGYIDRIERLLPEARFIHLIRDGRDVAISVRGLWFAPGEDMASIARSWVSAIRTGRRLGARCRHYLEVRYESLVRDPTPELQRICSFIGLDFDERMERHSDRARERLREMTPAGMMDKPSEEIHEMVRFATMPPEPSRAQRWRQEMGKRDRLEFERVAGPLLDELGYGSTVALHRRLMWRARSAFRR
jgi:hypothetical protein